MQVEPGESDVFDPVPCLETGEIRCDEGLIGGVLDPVRGQFIGRGHGHGEAMGWRARGKRFLIAAEVIIGRVSPIIT